MYYQVISQCTQSLKNLGTCLDKAEQHAAAKKFDVGVLMTSRLAPDMQHFIYQVQSACDYVKAAAAWLSGQTPPKHEDDWRRGLPAADDDPQHLFFPHRDGLRHAPPQRRRCRQDGFSWSYQSGRCLIGLDVPFKRPKCGAMSASGTKRRLGNVCFCAACGAKRTSSIYEHTP